MGWQDDLELVIAHTRVESYRERCADSHPQHELWRARMAEKASALRGRPAPEYPPFRSQAVNALAAAGRVVAAVVRREPVAVAPEVRAARLAICEACDRYDPARQACTSCGCGGLKLVLATEVCPLKKW